MGNSKDFQTIKRGHVPNTLRDICQASSRILHTSDESMLQKGECVTMSERSEMEHVSRFSVGTIPLSVLIEFISQKVYTDLMLPSKTDLEKKIEIATFFSRTQHIFIRLEALVKWSNSASKVDKCEKISNFLEEQTFFLISTANKHLSSVTTSNFLFVCRLPPFSVLSAIEVFTKKGYTRLPKSIKVVVESFLYEKQEVLLNLNSLIQTRLSLSQIPNQFRKIKITNGRAHFLVPNEFSVSFAWFLAEVFLGHINFDVRST
ncbi:unnamed protein product [Trichobilharzia regenti]|nr:unnamed protein product [Trichobilharzia regenti]